VIKEYYSLTKTELVLGNLITVIAGFILGSVGKGINGGLLVATIIGICLVMASGCVFNNYIDRDIDRHMERTKHRALVNNKIKGRSALIFGSVLGVLGFLILGFCTNAITTAAAFTGFFFYVVMYSIWAKRRSAYGTVVGAISGAIPPVVGYCAASGSFDVAALILFIILVTWQMPHFFAIAIRREDDYAAAKIPVMPVRHGIKRTKISMIIYIVEFIFAASLLTIFGYAGYIYLTIALLLGLTWLALGIRGFWIKGAADKIWARQMFLLSLVVMIVLFTTIAIGALA
jgi:protoheme IX farnesyltransferase